MSDLEIWSVRLAASAIRDLDRLPQKVVPAVIEFMYGQLAKRPFVVGKALRDDFAGEWSARRGSYRVLYRLDNENKRVIVSRITAGMPLALVEWTGADATGDPS